MGYIILTVLVAIIVFALVSKNKNHNPISGGGYGSGKNGKPSHGEEEEK